VEGLYPEKGTVATINWGRARLLLFFTGDIILQNMANKDPNHPTPREGEESTLPLETLPQERTPSEQHTQDLTTPLAPSSERGPYQLQEELGRGGLGRVMKAFDRRLERTVAIKEALSNRGSLERFWREAKLTARLEHPSIVPVHEAGVSPEGEPFYAMKLISGEPFDAVLAKCQEQSERLALLPRVIAVCEAVAYAHSKKIIHRDLKPQNILCGSFGETIVIDWGLAKEIGSKPDEPSEITKNTTPSSGEGRPELTTAGSILGTPAYMPLEQAQGKSLDERADVYSLGAVLYQTLSGRTPYTADSSRGVLAKISKEAHTPLVEVAPELPTDLLAIVEKAMSRNAKDRYPSAKELAEDLKRFQLGQLVGVYQYSPQELVLRWLKRHKLIVSLSLSMLVILLLGGLFSYSRISQAYDDEKMQRDIAESNEKRALIAEKDALARQREAERQSLALFQEQGRQLLLQEETAKALPFLLQAYQQVESLHEDLPALRVMMSIALHRLPSLMHSLSRKNVNVRFTPGGASILLAGYDHSMSLWRPETKRDPLPLAGSGYDDFSFSKDGAWLAVGTPDGSTLLQNTTKEGMSVIFADEYNAVLNADGTLLASTNKSSELLLRELPSQKLLLREKLSATPNTFAFNEDSSALAIKTDKTLSLWDISTLKKRWERDASGGSAMIFTRQNTLLTTEIGVVFVWDATQGDILAMLSLDTPLVNASFIEANQGCDRLIVFTDEGIPSVWKLSSEEPFRLYSLPKLKGAFSFAHFNPEGDMIVTGSQSEDVKLWDASSGALLSTLKGRRSASFGANRDLVTTSFTHVEVWDLSTIATPKRFSLQTTQHSKLAVSLSRDGSLFTVQDEESAVALWDLKRNVPLLNGVPWELNSFWLTAYPKNKPVAIALTNSRELILWEMNAQKKIASLVYPQDKLSDFIFDESGERLLIVGADGAVMIDTLTGNILKRLDGEYVSALFSSDGAQIYLFSRNAVYRWGTSSEAELIAREAVLDLVLRPDASRIVMLGASPTLWDPSQKKLIATLGGHSAKVPVALFSPDGSLLVTGSTDNTARVWDGESGVFIAELSGHEDAISELAFTPDGLLLTASTDGSVKLWEPRSGQLLSSFGGYLSSVGTLSGVSERSSLAVSPDGSFFVYTGPSGALLWPLRLERGAAEEVKKKAALLLSVGE
jgi:serine/threonine protein kinase/WD40 repeat protein